MKNVRILPALPKVNKKLRVAAYCRVSTFGPTQLHSLEIRVRLFGDALQELKRVKGHVHPPLLLMKDGCRIL